MERDNPVLIFVELGPDGGLLPLSLECVTAGRRLAGMLGCGVHGLVMGSAVGEAAEALSRFGLDRVYAVDHSLLETYHPETACGALAQACERVRPKAVLMGETLLSIDLAPRVAFSLHTGLITDCVGFEMDKSDIHFIKPVYSSNVMAAYALTTEPYLVTMQSRVEEPAEGPEDGGAEVIGLEVDLDAITPETEVMERVLEEEEEGPKLTSADIIVSGGRGVGGPEGFAQLAALAALLNGAVGASRPPVDLGWAPPKAQVGQTGEKVGPSVYVAVGISGATQHLAGVSASRTIVAINKDSRANIFKVADYGVVGRFEELLPAFHEALKEILGQGGVG
jgi:electron transfer flavoprotein alpha subunit